MKARDILKEDLSMDAKVMETDPKYKWPAIHTKQPNISQNYTEC